MSNANLEIVLQTIGKEPEKASAQEIVVKSSDGRELYTISIDESGALDIRSGGFTTHNDIKMDDSLCVQPRSLSQVRIERNKLDK